MNVIAKYVTAAFLALSAAASVSAEDVSKQEWNVTPYLWLPSMDVTSKIPGLPPADLDLGFDEIWDTFDVLALSARGEYWWGEWGVVVDGLYMDLSADNLGLMGNADIQISEGIVDAMAAWRVNLTEGINEAVSARLMAGGRYHYLKQKANVGPASFGGSHDWVELVFAGQLVAPMGEKWLATARGDIAGFGIGSGTELTWSLMAGVGYKITDHWMAKLGYRYYDIDYSRGSGLQGFGLDGSMQGPWIGISYGM